MKGLFVSWGFTSWIAESEILGGLAGHSDTCTGLEIQYRSRSVSHTKSRSDSDY